MHIYLYVYIYICLYIYIHIDTRIYNSCMFHRDPVVNLLNPIYLRKHIQIHLVIHVYQKTFIDTCIRHGFSETYLFMHMLCICSYRHGQ